MEGEMERAKNGVIEKNKESNGGMEKERKKTDGEVNGETWMV